METEENSQLSFLNTIIQRNSDNTISVRVYRKPTQRDQYLKFTTHHLARAKKSVITSLFDRAKNIISNPSDQEKEEKYLTAVLHAYGYPKKFINSTIRASQLPRQSANSDNTENQEQIHQQESTFHMRKAQMNNSKESLMTITSIAHFTQP